MIQNQENFERLKILTSIVEQFIDKKIENQAFIEVFADSEMLFLHIRKIKNFIISDLNEEIINNFIKIQKNKLNINDSNLVHDKLIIKKLKDNNIVFLKASIELLMKNSNFGDIIFIDSQDMEIEQQKQIIKLSENASLRGCIVIVKNNYTQYAKMLYNKCSQYILLPRENSKSNEEIVAIYAK